VGALRWGLVLGLGLGCRGRGEPERAERPERGPRKEAARSEAEREALRADPDAPKLGDGLWFTLAAFVPTAAPRTDKHGRPIKGSKEDRGGEAVAVFDADRDGRQDVLVVNGSDYFTLALNQPDAERGVRFKSTSILDGDPDDRISGRAKGLGLHDLDGDGFLDVWLANQGKGGVITYKRDPPNDKGLYRSAAFSTWMNRRGELKPGPADLDGAGSKRLALFEDFDGDGHTDAWVGASSYYGVWYAGGVETSQLYPGGPSGFGPDALSTAFEGYAGFFVDAQARSVKNFKGGIVRDLDRDGRPDVVAGSIADLWANWELELTQPGQEGYQGDWDRGLFLFQNRSEPGKLRFVDVSKAATAVSWGRAGEGHVHSVLALDIDHDGDLDIVASGNKGMLSHGTLEHDSPVLRVLRNDSAPGKIVLTDVTQASGLGFLNTRDQLPDPYPITATEFGVTQTLFPALMAGAALDVDNDGHVDLVMVDRQTFSEDPESGQGYGLGAWLFLGDGAGGFRYVPTETHGVRGTARDVSYGDLDGDGRLDLVFVDGSTGGQYVSDDNRVWLNRTGEGRTWTSLRVDEPGNRFGIGARVTLRDQGAVVGYDELRTDFSYRSKHDAVLHFGLGARTTYELNVVFRDGKEATWSGVEAGRAVQIVRGAAAAANGVRYLAGRPGWPAGVGARDVDGDGLADVILPGDARGAVAASPGVLVLVE
jgi:hypothetical protein